ncbi:MAG: sulfite exporter TauE/SafE family protein [Acetobacteraceae bacterium]|nr:sulfite exporter TauE/SafE family protein [Acetobacteraceae bacterium]
MEAAPPLVPLLLGAALGGFVQGLSGFAYGLVALAVWAWVMEPQVAGPLVVFGSLVGQIMALPTIRRGFSPARTWPFVVGGVLGIPLGVVALQAIDPVGFKAALGAFLVVWCPIMLALRRPPRIAAGGRLADAAAGFGGGVGGGLGGLSGPVPILWATLRGWTPDEQRGVFQAFNLVVHALVMTAYVVSGTVTAAFLPLFALVAPAMVLPGLLGVRLYRRISPLLFRRIVLGLLTASGVMMLAASLPRLL